MGLAAKNRIDKKTIDDIPIESYAIGMYEGSSPFDLKPARLVSNPIISRKDFSNRKVNFVADPFAFFEDGMWYLFYETMQVGTRKANICVSTSSDLKSWTEGKLVLEEPFHLSYPQVFKVENTFYMLPETYEKDEVRLYKSSRFPFEWEFEKVLLPFSCVDTTLYRKEHLWWLFTCDTPHKHDRLRLYYSDDLLGEWKEHISSPIHERSNDKSRLAGKILQYDGKMYRFAQDCKRFYGESVRVFEIEVLNTQHYRERELDKSPILVGGESSWNRVSMHHIDVHEVGKNQWIAFVDGRAH